MVDQRQDERPDCEGELFRLLAENVRDYAIFVVDTQGRVQTWPMGAERLLGYREQELLGEFAHVLFTPEDVQKGVPEQEMEQARLTGRGEDDRWHVRKDGTRFWSSGVMTPLRNEAGELRGFAKIMRDRTEWKASELARKKSEAGKAAVLETSLDAIITIDHEDRIVEFNPAAEVLFGYRRAAVLGQKMAELIIPPDLRPLHDRGMAHYLATGEGPVLGKHLEMRALRADGTEFPVELAITRVPTDEAVLFTGFARDITQREAQERRRAAQLAVTQVLAQAPDTAEAAPRILAAIGVNVGWDIGGFWLVDQQAQVLRCLEVWHQPGVAVGEFANASRRQTFASGSGLPGRVWSSGEPTWLADVTRDDNFPRLQAAADVGLRGAFAVPLRLGDDVLGVVEFLSRSIAQPDADLLGMMTTVGAQIGQFMQRKNAELALRESEQRFRGLMEQAPFSVQVFSPDGQTLQVNRAWEKLWGAALEDVAHYNILQDAQLEARGVLSQIQQAFAGEPAHVPAIQYDPKQTLPELTHHADPRRWVSAVAYPLKDARGRVREVILVHDDITASKQAEDTRQENEDRLRLALEAGRMGTWKWDIRTNDVTWSPQLEEIHGLPAGTFPGTFEAYQQDMHPDDREHVLASIQASLAAGKEHHLEYRLVLPDGSLRWVEAWGKLFRDEAGKPVQMIGVCMEVTARKKAEHDLRFLAEASRSLATLVDYESTLQKIAGLAVPHFADWCAIYLPDESDKLRQLAVAHVDPSKIRLAEEVRDRWPPDPSTPGGAFQVFRTGQSVLIEDVSEDILREAIADDEHFEVLRALGWRSYMCVPLSVRGNTIGVMVFIAAESGRRYTGADLALAEDLARRAAIASENARLYATLRDEGRRKDEFLAMLAHELRNPLAPIRSGLDLLGMAGIDAEVLDTMQQQVEQLVRLVDDLLDVSRIMRGKVDLRKQPVELAEVLNRAVETVRPLTEQQGQPLSIFLPDEPVWLNADPVRLAQVIGNLLNNASKYTEGGGHIRLAAEPQDGHVLIRVCDTGIGIAPELLPHVFDLFTQDQRTIDRSQGGLGIGLTVVKSLVEMHGGSVTVNSAGPGQGSEFTVRLPTAPQPQGDADSGEEPGSTPPFRILVVDDNVSAARMLGLLLAKLGHHEIFTAHDGHDALSTARQHLPDLILLDIGLPKLDGFEVARRLRQQPELHRTRIVALTGYGTEADRRKSLEAGFDEHLVKPPGVDMLQQLLARANPRSR